MQKHGVCMFLPAGCHEAENQHFLPAGGTGSDCNPDPVLSVPGYGIRESLIPRFWDPAGITRIPEFEIPQC